MRIFSDADLEEVARCLDDGAVVGIPTDTVYGLAASLNVPDAVRSLFTVKGRPETVPLPVLADSLSTVEECVGELESNSRTLATAYWPGPLTIIVPGPQVLCEVCANLPSSVVEVVEGKPQIRRVGTVSLGSMTTTLGL